MNQRTRPRLSATIAPPGAALLALAVLLALPVAAAAQDDGGTPDAVTLLENAAWAEEHLLDLDRALQLYEAARQAAAAANDHATADAAQRGAARVRRLLGEQAGLVSGDDHGEPLPLEVRVRVYRVVADWFSTGSQDALGNLLMYGIATVPLLARGLTGEVINPESVLPRHQFESDYPVLPMIIGDPARAATALCRVGGEAAEAALIDGMSHADPVVVVQSINNAPVHGTPLDRLLELAASETELYRNAALERLSSKAGRDPRVLACMLRVATHEPSDTAADQNAMQWLARQAPDVLIGKVLLEADPETEAGRIGQVRDAFQATWRRHGSAVREAVADALRDARTPEAVMRLYALVNSLGVNPGGPRPDVAANLLAIASRFRDVPELDEPLRVLLQTVGGTETLIAQVTFQPPYERDRGRRLVRSLPGSAAGPASMIELIRACAGTEFDGDALGGCVDLGLLSRQFPEDRPTPQQAFETAEQTGDPAVILVVARVVCHHDLDRDAPLAERIVAFLFASDDTDDHVRATDLLVDHPECALRWRDRLTRLQSTLPDRSFLALRHLRDEDPAQTDQELLAAILDSGRVGSGLRPYFEHAEDHEVNALQLWCRLHDAFPDNYGLAQVAYRMVGDDPLRMHWLDVAVERFDTLNHGELRLQLVEFVLRVQHPGTLDLVGKALRDGDPQVRDAAREAFALLRDQREALEAFERWRSGVERADQTLHELLTLLGSDNRDVRLGAIRSLGALRSKTALPALARLLGDDDAAIREAANAAIERIAAE